MKDIQDIKEKGAAATMADVLAWTQENGSISPATRKDYIAQLKRCSTLCNANDLRDVPADLEEFQQRFPLRNFPFEHFKTARAYQAWRKKTITVLKGFHGLRGKALARQSQQDAWSTLIELVQRQVEARLELSLHLLIPIRLLADEARKTSLSPQDLTDTTLAVLYSMATPGRRSAIVKALRALEHLRGVCSEIQSLLPPAALQIPGRGRDMPEDIPPHLLAQIKAIIEEHCAGEIDDILDERVGAKAGSTAATYTAALKKYVGAGLRAGAISTEVSTAA